MNSRRDVNSASSRCAAFSGDRDEQTARGLRVVAEGFERLRQALGRNVRSCEVAVPRIPARAHTFARQVERAVDRREALGLQPHADAAAVRDLVRVTEEPEPGHVGHSVGLESAQHVRSVLVERAHPVDRALELHLAREALLVAGHDQAGSERLRQEERVAGLRAALRPDAVRANGADDCKPVLRLGVANRVSPGEQAAGRAHLLISGGEDLREHLHRQLFRKRRDREREQRDASHCENVVECVGRCDRAVVAGVVDDRREEVEREDERALVVQAVDGRIVRRREPDEEVLRLDGHEAREQLLEARSRVLGGAASA